MNVGHRFAREWVLRGVRAVLEPGTLFHIAGPNGSGKTTLLRILAGVLAPREGELRWGGARLAGGRLQDFRARAALHLTQPALYAGLSVAENLDFFESLTGRGADSRARGEILAALGIDGISGKRVASLSDGQRQRVSLARVFLARREYLFLDEPFAHLDDEGASALSRLIERQVSEGCVVAVAGPLVESPVTVNELRLGCQREEPCAAR